uniref:Uncharacterized protein n=1 Tax=Sphaerodactylus townsendi TaxID=933632 RepID=A0ACB8FI93_9SAUR
MALASENWVEDRGEAMKIRNERSPRGNRTDLPTERPGAGAPPCNPQEGSSEMNRIPFPEELRVPGRIGVRNGLVLPGKLRSFQHSQSQPPAGIQLPPPQTVESLVNGRCVRPHSFAAPYYIPSKKAGPENFPGGGCPFHRCLILAYIHISRRSEPRMEERDLPRRLIYGESRSVEQTESLFSQPSPFVEGVLPSRNSGQTLPVLGGWEEGAAGSRSIQPGQNGHDNEMPVPFKRAAIPRAWDGCHVDLGARKCSRSAVLCSFLTSSPPRLFSYSISTGNISPGRTPVGP